MPVAETSLEAYYDIKRIAREQCRKVRAFIEANPDVTNEQISEGLRMKIQAVTPRVKELKENGVVWITGTAKTSTGRSAKTVRAATCPRCMSTGVMAERRDAVSFRYHCWNCGCDFVARVGEHSADEVEVTM